MACGLGLGILLVFLVQAEHVGCIWTKEAKNIQNSNTHVGFPPANVRLLKSGRDPQNQVRQGFSYPHMVQSSGSNTGPAVYSGSGPGLSTRSLARVSQPAQSSVRLVQSSSVFKAHGQKPFSPRANAAKQSSGGSMKWYQKNPSTISRRSWPVQQKMQRSSKYPTSSSRAVLGRRESFSFRQVPQSAAQEPSWAAAGKVPPYSRTGSSAVLFGPVAPGQHGRTVQMQTFARGRARRVFSNCRSEESKPKGFSPQDQTWKQFVAPQVGYQRRSWPQTYKTSNDPAVYQIPEHFGGFAIRRL